ncbi:hypothetical protein KQH49_07245 [Mycetohabitans sp. B5]|uniref:Uncharacterized protein n=1 Tax=Mycetohabitans endofungorum TaxID=417203 RepID=A0A2P5K9T9_9BURK|nr:MULTISPECIES: hypothetical protein [Mycetohabitans]MCG1054762.1 hypothetical protein [Mycetohabitans sp. B5]PPB83487.1 hypothetical protein B0O95_1071 [Mycetohabitans endofungorum]
MSYLMKRRKLYRRFALGYLGILGMILVPLLFSIIQGAGWKSVLAGVPGYLTFFFAVSWQFVKELRALKREKREAENSARNGEQ